MSFVSVPREQFSQFMTRHGFKPSTEGKELTFIRSAKACPNLKMIVYSSIPVTGDVGRGNGEDAIRVCLVWFPAQGESQGVESTKRVYRTGSSPTDYASVLKRLEDRLRGMAKEAADMLATRCGHCGGPTYSDSGRCRIIACRKRHPHDARPVKPALPPNEVIAAEAAREAQEQGAIDEREMQRMEAEGDRAQTARDERAKFEAKKAIEGQF
jgi:hypothetical protein